MLLGNDLGKKILPELQMTDNPLMNQEVGAETDGF